MKKNECIAMLLAGGQGSRLLALTKSIAKPAVSFGGKYRIIDFSLSNCANSDISTVGVLTQYRPFLLNSYISSGTSWDLNSRDGGVFVLPPYATESGGAWYEGTADAIYRNIEFMDIYDSDYVLILSGDHLYRMDYRKMLENHKAKGADLSVSVMQVPWEDASRFGIITADEDGRIVKFTEKPAEPDSNLASMGIYIFSKKTLVKALIEDHDDPESEHDFGKNIIPKLLAEGKNLFTYEFSGFWKDVGTIPAYHETSMALLEDEPEFVLDDPEFPFMSNSNIYPPQFIGPDADVKQSLVSNGCCVKGKVIHSVLSTNSYVEEGAFVKDSVLLPGSRVKSGAVVIRAILGENAVVEADCVLGSEDENDEIALLGNDECYGEGGLK
ncbi:MAG: glucose-1-phosphate adenylyltransferase [Eubacteriaceae bacterium]|nr:glucose-1-phosphate adenylyltransferase [Eubacteriaceae bacterium]